MIRLARPLHELDVMERHDFITESGRANHELQENLDRNETRILASYGLVGAIIVFGGLGYAVDRWAGTSPWCLLIGLVLGVLLGFAGIVTTTRGA